jgi:hypothetical protein
MQKLWLCLPMTGALTPDTTERKCNHSRWACCTISARGYHIVLSSLQADCAPPGQTRHSMEKITTHSTTLEKLVVSWTSFLGKSNQPKCSILALRLALQVEGSSNCSHTSSSENHYEEPTYPNLTVYPPKKRLNLNTLDRSPWNPSDGEGHHQLSHSPACQP